MITKVSPSLWFEKEAEDAVHFYISIFPNSSINRILYYGDAGYEFHQQAKGTVMLIEFTLDSVPFSAINGGIKFEYTPAISLVLACENQKEVDYYWEKLGEGGEYQQCGWLKDKYGISWQIEPTILRTFSQDDIARNERVFEAMMQMEKLDIALLKKAYDG